ncbi:MAG: serine/threonine protein kinase [Nocardioides sp.]|nr:serine/threonine protein kinase [Nocardioides sp.]
MTTSPRPQTPPSGLTVGGYALLTRLGEGGMGVVHLAQRPGGDRVALKVLRPHIIGDDESRARLAREVGSLSRIRSRRVAEIVDADPWGDVPYVATRYVPGLSLHDEIQENGPILGVDLTWLGRCLAEALTAVHSVGVLHRDIKPSNVLMEGRTPILIDFGLARVADDPRITHTGWLLGTPGYLAPEILYGDDATTASDVHSWAATVGFAALGRAPFGRGPSMAIMDRVRRGEHDLAELDDPMRDVLNAALDPDPSRRPTLPALVSWLENPRARDVIEPIPQPMREPEPDLFTLPLAVAASARAENLTAHEPAAPSVVPHRTGSTSVLPSEGDTAWLADGPVSVQGRPPVAERLRRFVSLLSLASVGGGAVAFAPYLSVAGLLVLTWLLRSGSMSASAAGDRRRARGAKWYDGPQTLLATPWHVLAGIPGTLLLALWAGGIAAAVGLLCFAAATGPVLALGLCGAALACGLWFGPGGSRVRRPLRRVVHPLAAQPLTWLVVTAVVLAVAAGLASLATSQGISWAPASGAPFSFLR